jgi:delta-aminolevulinic acid dehydratase/porphobilinogen synthase
MWYEEVDSILENKIYHWIFRKRIFSGLFNHIAGKRLKRRYHGFNHIIIYNGMVHERCMNVAKKVLPLYVTYGSQEMNQIIACNDFSTEAFMESGAIGNFIGNMWVSNKGELRVQSDTLFDHYIGDIGHTEYIRKDRIIGNEQIRTTDRAVQNMKSGAFIVLGRLKSAITMVDKEIQLDIIRGFPYVEECVLIPWDDISELKLLASPNQRLIEAHGLTVVSAERILNKFINEIREKLPECVNLVDASFAHTDFERTFDGKIKFSLYRPD